MLKLGIQSATYCFKYARLFKLLTICLKRSEKLRVSNVFLKLIYKEFRIRNTLLKSHIDIVLKITSQKEKIMFWPYNVL